MMRDIKDNIDEKPSLAPAARVNGTATGNPVDMQGYYSGMAVFEAGAWTDGTHTPSLFDSPDGTTFTAVGTQYLQGTLNPVSGTAGQNSIQRQGYIGPNRFLQGMLVVGGATTGMLSRISIVRGSPTVKPLA